MPAPIKRHPALQPLSRDHHRGLLFCWKIREGLKRTIAVDRIRAYAQWFWKDHLFPHFELEEKHIFPVLGMDNVLIQQAIKEHQLLKSLIFEDHFSEKTLQKIQTALNDHIRFEERILFNEIQRNASESQWQTIEKTHTDPSSCEIWPDRFWNSE